MESVVSISPYAKRKRFEFPQLRQQFLPRLSFLTFTGYWQREATASRLASISILFHTQLLVLFYQLGKILFSCGINLLILKKSTDVCESKEHKLQVEIVYLKVTLNPISTQSSRSILSNETILDRVKISKYPHPHPQIAEYIKLILFHN